MYLTIESVTILLSIIASFVSGNNLTNNASTIYTKHSPGARIKRAVQPPTCIDTKGKPIRLRVLHKANGVRRVTAMFMERPNPSYIRAPSTTQKKDAVKCISDYHNGRPSGPKSSSTTVQSYGTIRLDEQGAFDVNNYGRFDNYQLQINGKNVGKPSSVAHVNIQQVLKGYSQAAWKTWLVRGLHASLDGSGTVWVFQQVLEPGQNIRCPQQGK